MFIMAAAIVIFDERELMLGQWGAHKNVFFFNTIVIL